MADYVLTSYLTERVDTQRDKMWPADDDATVRTFLGSASRLGLRCVVFHDHLSEEFTRRWSLPGVEFVKMEWRSPWTCYEERHILYWEWLERNVGCEKVLIADLSDVEFYRDPFAVMRDAGLLYIETEPWLIGKTCVGEAMRQCYGKVSFADNRILNPGLWGGERVLVVDVLTRLVAEFCRATAPGAHRELSAFNRVIYRGRVPFSSGHPFHTQFKKYEGPESGAAVRHK